MLKIATHAKSDEKEHRNDRSSIAQIGMTGACGQPLDHPNLQL